MADQRKGGIAWTDRTWNPVRGCSIVSPGCHSCYAMTMAARFSGPGMPYEGLAERTRVGARWTGKVRLVGEHLEDPLRWRKPQRIFVNSMSDLFHERLTDHEILRVFTVMARAPQHTFQVLTKRPARMEHFVRTLPNRRPISWTDAPWPLPNVWLGVSVEDQARADERIPLLLQTPAAVRFVSYEPALGPVDFARWIAPLDICIQCDAEHPGGKENCPSCGTDNLITVWGEDQADRARDGCRTDEDSSRGCALDWVIVGGESGPGARPFHLRWARKVIAQCRAAKVACFFKQLGSIAARELGLADRKGGDVSEPNFPADLNVREFPDAS